MKKKGQKWPVASLSVNNTPVVNNKNEDAIKNRFNQTEIWYSEGKLDPSSHREKIKKGRTKCTKANEFKYNAKNYSLYKTEGKKDKN